MKKKIHSLSRKIVFLIAAVVLISILLIFNVFEKINKEAFASNKNGLMPCNCHF
jgi:cbb3-type cytochrome oxidase subunit 3